jgi:hypothetical protein
MDERDHALGPAPRHPVDQLNAVALDSDESAREIFDDVTDVMKRRPSTLGDEFRYAGLVADRLEQLDPLLLVAEESHTDTLINDQASRLGGEAEGIPEERERLVDTRDGYADVM